jgi:hypothetical protein
MNTEQIEIHAMHNDPLPAGLELPEQLLFMAFRALHQSVRFGQVTREQAHNEKLQLLDQFTDWMRWDGIYQDTCKMRVELGGLAKEMTVSDCPTCRQAIKIIDRRKV